MRIVLKQAMSCCGIKKYFSLDLIDSFYISMLNVTSGPLGGVILLRSIFHSLALFFFLIIFTTALIIYPEQSLLASIKGLHAWWEIVFPSLLPFFIMAELLISFGVVQFIGVLLEPMMRPLFNVPGIGSFAWIVGMASGFPAGAKISARLREKEQMTQVEAERLVSFSNAASPLFLFGAIAVGFFHNTKIGIFIAISHYISNILVGICMRFYKYERSQRQHKKSTEWQNIIILSLKKMHHTRLSDQRTFGDIVGDAVISSVQTLLMIGGFIILFSVLTTLLQLLGFFKVVLFILTPLLTLLHIPSETVYVLLPGLFEITIGANAISSSQTLPLQIQLALVSFILGFNGFSIHAQVASILSKTDIRFTPYFFSRILHAIFASILTILLFPLFKEKEHIQSVNVIDSININSLLSWQSHLLHWIQILGPIITICTLFVACYILFNRIFFQKS